MDSRLEQQNVIIFNVLKGNFIFQKHILKKILEKSQKIIASSEKKDDEW